MAKSLKTLIRLARWSVDERRKALGALLDREAQILQAREDHHQALANERTVASADSIGAGRMFGAYFTAWEAQRDHLNALLDEVQKLIEIARDELAEAFRAQKSTEEVQKQRDIQEAIEADRKERAELDEIGLIQHLRKKDE